ncbi:MAG: hypothetical protein NUV56_04415, partial [Candidatus Uhrbacteria bacterium]|nr:hypothetical protein [Candidatus Uhrbacteria bacterium]
MLKTITTEKLVASILVILGGLLIGLRFDAKWAGGEGYKEQATFLGMQTVTPGGEPADTGLIEANRGDILQTGPYMRQFRTYGYDYPCNIWLDQNTAVTITNAQENETTFALTAGRILVDCKATVTAREASVTFDGTGTAVNYSWLYKMDSALIEGNGTYVHGDATGDLILGTTYSMNTIDTSQTVVTIGEFDPTSSAASDF